MNVHSFMNELDQKDYSYPRKIQRLKFWKSMYKVNGENLSSLFFYKYLVVWYECALVISHIQEKLKILKIWQSSIEREGDTHNFA